jgi:acetyltransferase-like isoleucine patch superfamily enzyme
MNCFKDDLRMIREFIQSDRKTVSLSYRKPDPYYLNYFCKLLDHPLRAKINGILCLLQQVLIFSFLKIALYKLLQVRIGQNTYLGPFVKIDPHLPNLVSIGENVLIGIDTKIITHEMSRNKLTLGKVKIGNNVVIGAYSIIKCGVEIGNNAELAMGTVVYKDVPENSVAIGNPAKIVRKKTYAE